MEGIERMTVKVKLYDDHRAAGYSDGGGYPTIYLCDTCAQKRDGDVTHQYTPAAEEELYCQDCGSPTQAAQDGLKRDAESHFRGEPGASTG